MWLTIRQVFDQVELWAVAPPPTGGQRPRRIRTVRGAVYFLAWMLWILMGTFFYAYAPDSNLGFVKGFYMAINVGYSIGWGDIPQTNYNYYWFSSLYVLMGASFVAIALTFFASRIVQDTDNWFTNIQQEEEYKVNHSDNMPWYTRRLASVKHNWEKVRSILLWILWIVIMIIYSLVQIKWPLNNAQYFAISSLSTGGLLSIPIGEGGEFDQPDWIYGLTGFFCATGIPLMAVAMSSVAGLMVDSGHMDELKKIMKEDVTEEEILMLQRFQLEDGDGVVDRAEFIILCLLRVGADPTLIKFISDRFNELDKNKDGTLTMSEIICKKDDTPPLGKLNSDPNDNCPEERDVDEATLPMSHVSVGMCNSFELESNPSPALTVRKSSDCAHGRHTGYQKEKSAPPANSGEETNGQHKHANLTVEVIDEEIGNEGSTCTQLLSTPMQLNASSSIRDVQSSSYNANVPKNVQVKSKSTGASSTGSQ